MLSNFQTKQQNEMLTVHTEQEHKSRVSCLKFTWMICIHQKILEQLVSRYNVDMLTLQGCHCLKQNGLTDLVITIANKTRERETKFEWENFKSEKLAKN